MFAGSLLLSCSLGKSARGDPPPRSGFSNIPVENPDRGVHFGLHEVQIADEFQFNVQEQQTTLESTLN